MARLDAESRAGMPGAGPEGSEQNSRGAEPRASIVTATQCHSCLETESLMEAVVARENTRAALARVESNRGAPGVDAMTTEALGGYLREHWSRRGATLL